MKLVHIYQCLCDETRLRILSLLLEGELCVCHIQEILGEPQVKVSKHLAYLRGRGLVVPRRKANWVIYSLPARQSAELSANLACLQDCAREHPVFRADAARLRQLKAALGAGDPACCPPARRPRHAKR
jgi:ArsR family transcriptional regulator, arsenate/arsenite/antimonite-responsive transcriptional repressor